MVPSPSGRNPLRTSAPSRRTVLQTGAVLIAAGLAGCELRQRSEDGSGDGTGDGSGDGAGDGAGDDTPTAVPPDASYDLTVENGITESDLEPVEALSPTTPVTITVDVQKDYDDRDDEVLFERTVELAPGENRTFEDAFSTEPDGPEYIVAAEFEPLQEPDEDWGTKSRITSAERFQPGGFGAPTRPEFFVVVMDGEEGEGFDPWLLVRNERPRRRD